jgi:hypothetical protein
LCAKKFFGAYSSLLPRGKSIKDDISDQMSFGALF